MAYFLVPEDRVQVCSDNLVVILWSDTHNARVAEVTEKSTALLNDQQIVEDL